MHGPPALMGPFRVLRTSVRVTLAQRLDGVTVCHGHGWGKGESPSDSPTNLGRRGGKASAHRLMANFF